MTGLVPLLEVRHVSRSFEGLHAVSDASFSVAPGTVTCLIGPNGAGKTTMFNLISGLLGVSAGEILFEGSRIDTMPAQSRAGAGIGRTFQDPRIFYEMPVLEHLLVALPLRATHPLWALLRDRRTKAEWRDGVERARALLARIGLAGRECDRAQDLSFGEQRFLSIARVLAGNPRLVLLDEPTVGLDDPAIERLIELIAHMVREEKKTVLLVEHNMAVVFRISDYIHLMVQGSVVESGPAAQMRANPRMIEAYLGSRYAAHGS